MIPLTSEQTRHIVKAFEGLPISVRADCLKHVHDLLRPLRHIDRRDVSEAVRAAKSRYVWDRRP